MRSNILWKAVQFQWTLDCQMVGFLFHCNMRSHFFARACFVWWLSFAKFGGFGASLWTLIPQGFHDRFSDLRWYTRRSHWCRNHEGICIVAGTIWHVIIRFYLQTEANEKANIVCWIYCRRHCCPFFRKSEGECWLQGHFQCRAWVISTFVFWFLRGQRTIPIRYSYCNLRIVSFF